MDLSRINDVETLREMVRVQLRESERLREALKKAYLELRDKDTKKAEQLALRLAEVERQHAAALKMLFGQTTERRPKDKPAKAKPAQSGHGRRAQPKLPKQDVVHVLDDVDERCALCSTPLVEWNGQFEESEEIDFIAPKLIVRRHLRQKYRCTCGGCIITAPGPRKLFPKARYSINLALHVAVQKYAFHMPLDRQVKAFAQQGLDVTSATLWDYLLSLYGLLSPALERLESHILAQPVIGADETKWRLLRSESRGKSKVWWVWVRRADDAVHYAFAPSRSKEVAISLLENYEGTVMVDGYACYESAANANPKMKLAHCWSHARRELLPFEKDPKAARALRVIQRMYRLEALAREKRLPPDELLLWRRRKTKPLLRALFKWMGQLLIPDTYDLRKAMVYILKRQEGLTRFLDNVLLAPDNNATERVIRCLAVGRKNHYGSVSEQGTRVAALFYSLIESAQLAGIEPMRYLRRAVAAAHDGEEIPLPHELVETEAVAAAKV